MGFFSYNERMIQTLSPLVNGIRNGAAVGQALGDIQLKNHAAFQALAEELNTVKALLGTASYVPADSVASSGYGEYALAIVEV